jgi:hypothetical protein
MGSMMARPPRRSRHSCGIPDSPKYAPANYPHTAPVVSASSPRLTAGRPLENPPRRETRTGASRIIEPLPLARGESSPEVRASPVAANRRSEAAVVTTNVKGPAGHRVHPGLPPREIALGLMVQIPATLSDAVGKRQRHARVVGPLTRGQPVWPAAPVVRYRFKRPAT